MRGRCEIIRERKRAILVVEKRYVNGPFGGEYGPIYSLSKVDDLILPPAKALSRDLFDLYALRRMPIRRTFPAGRQIGVAALCKSAVLRHMGVRLPPCGSSTSLALWNTANLRDNGKTWRIVLESSNVLLN